MIQETISFAQKPRHMTKKEFEAFFNENQSYSLNYYIADFKQGYEDGIEFVDILLLEETKRTLYRRKIRIYIVERKVK